MDFEIYTELSRKQLKKIQSGELYICLPDGVKMINKNGSRSLYFYCEDENIFTQLVEGIEGSGLNWELI